MSRFFLLMLTGVCLGLFTLTGGADEKTASDADKLKGTYTVTKGERDGKALEADRFKGSIVTFTDDKVMGTDKDKKEFFGSTYTLDMRSKPWKIEMTSTSPKKDEKAAGVIEVSGDTVKICYNLPGGKVPTDFKAGEKQHCFTLKRMKTTK